MNERLKELFKARFREEPVTITSLGAHASNRKIYRLSAGKVNAIGVENLNIAENRTFIEFTKHFRKYGVHVPEIYGQDLAAGVYLEEDLGDLTLYDALEQERKGQPGFPEKILKLYKEAVSLLPIFQIVAGRALNYKLCYPKASYDRDSMIWDMHFFRDSYLKRAKIKFVADRLEHDFHEFAKFLLEADSGFFMYRDFQSRNIMVRGDRLAFIDYQSGRQGPLQYDVASLLYQSKADIPNGAREEILEVYLDTAEQHIKIDRFAFQRLYKGIVLIRLMQVLGTYGEQGLNQGKTYFIEAIPYALKNLKYLMEQDEILPPGLTELENVFRSLVGLELKKIVRKVKPELRVEIISFSYKHGIPVHDDEHGGGFVFDCRCLPNPGREEKYRHLTGLHPEVREYLEANPDVNKFAKTSLSMVEQAIKNYIMRGFTSLRVGFGCTGGQHRSVYLASLLAEKLRKKKCVRPVLIHREISEMVRAPVED